MALSLQSLKKALNDLQIGRRIISQRSISTSAALLGKRNFRKFHLGNKRGTRFFRRDRNAGKYEDIPVETAVRPTGFKYGERFIHVPEMIPEFIVPDLKDCQLKPYVSYRVEGVYQEPFTPENLFEACYESKVDKDFREKKLDENYQPKEPSDAEKLTPEMAWIQARKTGSDLFSERIPRVWECLEIDVAEYLKQKNEKRGYHFTEVLRRSPEEDEPKPIKKSSDSSSE